MHKIACYKCRNEWTFEGILGRADECPACHFDAHVCLNCKHFDLRAHHECRENQADYVQNKEKSNFCDYFEPKSQHFGFSSEAETAKSQLDALFSKAEDKPANPSEEKKSDSESLADQLKRFLEKR